MERDGSMGDSQTMFGYNTRRLSARSGESWNLSRRNGGGSLTGMFTIFPAALRSIWLS